MVADYMADKVSTSQKGLADCELLLATTNGKNPEFPFSALSEAEGNIW